MEVVALAQYQKHSRDIKSTRPLGSFTNLIPSLLEHPHINLQAPTRREFHSLRTSNPPKPQDKKNGRL